LSWNVSKNELVLLFDKTVRGEDDCRPVSDEMSQLESCHLVVTSITSNGLVTSKTRNGLVTYLW